MKKTLIIFLVILICFAVPVFSQNQNRNANADRSQALSDAMENSIKRNKDKLEGFDEEISGTGSTKTYSVYKRKYDSIIRAMNDSEYRFNLYVRTNDTKAKIQSERDRYEELLNDLESLKSEYDKNR